MTSSISGHLLQQIELIVEERPIEDRDDRFGRVNRQRAQPRAFAPGEQDRLHAQPPMLSCEAAHEPAELADRHANLSRAAARRGAADEVRRAQILGVRKELVGAAIFGIASLTDWADGYLARRRKQVTPLGQLMDPLADKLLISAALISLVQMDLAPAWMVAVIIGREFAVTALRSLALRARRGDAGVAARQDQDGRAGRRDSRADPRHGAAAAFS